MVIKRTGVRSPRVARKSTRKGGGISTDIHARYSNAQIRRKIRELHHFLDGDGNGGIDPRDIDAFFRSINYPNLVTPDVFNGFDVDRDGSLNLEEFSNLMDQLYQHLRNQGDAFFMDRLFEAMVPHRPPIHPTSILERYTDEDIRRNLANFFYMIDPAETGALENRQINAVFRSLGYGELVTREMFDLVDVNRDGRLNLDEFIDLMVILYHDFRSQGDGFFLDRLFRSSLPGWGGDQHFTAIPLPPDDEDSEQHFTAIPLPPDDEDSEPNDMAWTSGGTQLRRLPVKGARMRAQPGRRNGFVRHMATK